MYDAEQMVEVKWGARNRKHYENLGYTFTGMGTTLIIPAKYLTPHSTALINLTCDYCGIEFTRVYSNHVSISKSDSDKIACNKCKSKKAYENIEEETKQYMFDKFLYACNVLGYNPISTIDEYENVNTKLKYICPKHGIKLTKVDNISRGQGCKQCAIESNADKRRKTIDEVIAIVESKNNNRILNPEDYKNMRTKNLKIECGSCKKITLRSLESIVYSDGKCRSCASTEVAQSWKYTPSEVQEIIESINNNILLNPEEYTGINDNNLRIKCGLCGNEYTSSLSIYLSGSHICCPECSKSMSNPERRIINFLEENNIDYKYQYTFSDCKNKYRLRFDFYIPKINTVIEYNGQQHYKPVEIFGGDIGFNEIKIRDEIKINYCINNNIEMLIIPYWDEKKLDKILNEKLKEAI